MLKRLMFLTTTVIIILVFCFIVFAKNAEKLNAIVTNKDGSQQFSLYIMDGKKCIALNDISVILKNTSYKFSYEIDKDNIVNIQKGKDFNEEKNFLQILEKEPSYSRVNADLNINGKTQEYTTYKIQNELFLKIDDLPKFIGCEMVLENDEVDKIYINKTIDSKQSITYGNDKIEYISHILDNSRLDEFRKLVKNTFIETYGEKSFTDNMQKRLDSDTICSSFILEEKAVKIKFYEKEIFIPYEKLKEFLNISIKTLFTITTNSSLEDDFQDIWCKSVSIQEDANYFNKSYIKPVEPYKDLVEIDKEKPCIALTFDDGPKKGTTDKILDVLEKNNARATFFVVGEMVEQYPELVKRQFEIGCQIGNHTYSHPILTKLTLDEAKSQVSKTSNLVEKETGQPTKIGRPPYGSLNREIKVASGFEWFNWSIDTYDWKTRDVDYIYNRIMNNAKNGSVILMHDLYPTNVQAVQRAVPELVKKGYQLVTMEELIEVKGGADKISGHIKK